jgi:hypothetical protein
MITSTVEEPCPKCIFYRAQLDQRNAIIAKYQKIVQFQTDLIQDFSRDQKITTTTSSTTNGKLPLVEYVIFFKKVLISIDSYFEVVLISYLAFILLSKSKLLSHLHWTFDKRNR